MTDEKQTIHSLSFKAKAALLDFANGKQVDRIQLDSLERQGLVEMVPALTIRGCEVAEEGGWIWPD